MNIDVTLMGTELEVDYTMIVPVRGAREAGGVPLEPDVEAGVEIDRVFVAGTNRTHEVTRLFDNSFMYDRLGGKIMDDLTEMMNDLDDEYACDRLEEMI